jgi:hypothetical protein
MSLDLASRLQHLDSSPGSDVVRASLKASYTKIPTAELAEVEEPVDAKDQPAGGLKGTLRQVMAIERTLYDAIGSTQSALERLSQLGERIQRNLSNLDGVSADDGSEARMKLAQAGYDELRASLDGLTSQTPERVLRQTRDSLQGVPGLFGQVELPELDLGPATDSDGDDPTFVLGERPVTEDSAATWRDRLLQLESIVRAKTGTLDEGSRQLASHLDLVHAARQNLSAASSRLADATVAQGMAELAKELIVRQSGLSTQAQAGQLTPGALRLVH